MQIYRICFNFVYRFILIRRFPEQLQGSFVKYSIRNEGLIPVIQINIFFIQNNAICLKFSIHVYSDNDFPCLVLRVHSLRIKQANGGAFVISQRNVYFTQNYRFVSNLICTFTLKKLFSDQFRRSFLSFKIYQCIIQERKTQIFMIFFFSLAFSIFIVDSFFFETHYSLKN